MKNNSVTSKNNNTIPKQIYVGNVPKYGDIIDLINNIIPFTFRICFI